MGIGIIFALAACFLWGLIFIIPEFLTDYSAIEVVIGRYFTYGAFSCILLFRKGFKVLRNYPLQAWGMAMVFAVTSHIFYYLGVVVGLRYITAPVTVLVLGMAPITIALYGNWHLRECSFRSLIVPCLWIAFGMILVNASEVDWNFGVYSVQQYLIGFLAVMGSLVGWSWYAVHNARFLKKNAYVPSGEWSTVIGVSTFVWVLIAIGLLFSGIYPEVNLNKFLHLSSSSLRFITGAVVLGVVCSWIGCYLWNRASLYLPVSLMGPFLIFETLFGLVFVFLVQRRIPNWLELMGFISMLGGILLSVYIFRKQISKSN